MFAAHADTNEMLKAILKSIDEGIHVIDKYGKTIYYNEIAANHDGMKESDVIGKSLLDVFPSLSTETSTMLKVIKSGVPIYNQHQTYRNIEGKLIDTVNTTIPIMVEQQLHGAVEIAKDYSRVKDLSNKLIELQTKMDNRQEKPKIVSKFNTIYRFNDILTDDPTMKKVIDHAKRISKTTSHIMVYGETGTGKELLVQGIHHHSVQSHGPFISQNCAAIPPSLLESVLFGTIKGSFTGAENKEGLFELAHGGTLFLDEIHTLPFELQAKLLRVLEDGIIRRIGSHTAVQTNVRIITATNEHPDELLKKKLLRKDLYYRLNVVSLFIPPLRERINDLPMLIAAFIQSFNQNFQMNVQGIAEDAMTSLMRYDWPGNIRELRHTIESAMNITDSPELLLVHFPAYLTDTLEQTNFEVEQHGLKYAVEEYEKNVVQLVFEQENHNILRTAKKLGIPRQTLQYKLQKYEIH